MSTIALAATIASIALMGSIMAWVIAPLITGAAAAPDDDPRVLALLLARESALTEARDLDEALAAGRIRDEDHAARRRIALERGAAALQALDAIAAERSADSSVHAARIEAELARRLGDVPHGDRSAERVG